MQDADRLPEGVVRVGYDSDMQCYMFRDRDGVNYRGQPGMEFGGILTAISTPSTMGEDRRPTTTNDSSFEKTRPGAFADDKLDMGGGELLSFFLACYWISVMFGRVNSSHGILLDCVDACVSCGLSL